LSSIRKSQGIVASSSAQSGSAARTAGSLQVPGWNVGVTVGLVVAVALAVTLAVGRGLLVAVAVLVGMGVDVLIGVCDGTMVAVCVGAVVRVGVLVGGDCGTSSPPPQPATARQVIALRMSAAARVIRRTVDIARPPEDRTATR
jgi:hypothetical protein